MLDGLDEVANPLQSKSVSTWVSKQIRRYPESPFIVTSRPKGYESAPLYNVNLLQVQGFNNEQVKKFIHLWYLENEAKQAGKDDTDTCQRAKDSAEDLLQRLYKAPALNALTTNPLLLTMIAMVHRHHGVLPDRRADLYSEICNVLLSGWKEAKGLRDNLTAKQKRTVLEKLAAIMMQHRLRELSTDKAINIITIALQTDDTIDADAKTFLYDINESSGLLLETETEKWRFAHLTFQEYLAAAYFLKNNTSLDFSTLVDDSWWHETLRLYAAQGDATNLIKACISKDTVPALSLAADCLDEEGKIEKHTKEEAYKKLDDAIYSNSYERRTLAAEVKLYRRLSKPWRKITNNISISEPISCAEYQLFINDMLTKGINYQPDHWRTALFLDHQKPDYDHQKHDYIKGLRGEDAIAFCNWLNDIKKETKYPAKYRLPTTQENHSETDNNDNTPNQIIHYWCLDSDNPVIEYKNYQKVSDIEKLTQDSITHTCAADIPINLNFSSAQLLYTSIIHRFSNNFLNQLKPPVAENTRKHLLTAFNSALNRYIAIKNYSINNSTPPSLEKNNKRDSENLTQGLPYGLMRALIEDRIMSRPLDKTIPIKTSIRNAIANSLSSVIFVLFDINPPTSAEDNNNARKSDFNDRLQNLGKISQENKRGIDIRWELQKYINTIIHKHKLDSILYKILNSIKANNIIINEAFQRALLDIICYTLSEFDKLQSQSTEHGGKPTEYPTFEKLHESLESCYWWLTIVLSRRRKSINTWEGIRIIREKPQKK
jgi:hypothetical protein